MNDVERMREIMDLISDNMREQTDTDRMEMLAMLASTTAMAANLMSVNFDGLVKSQRHQLLEKIGCSEHRVLKGTRVSNV